MHAVMTEEGYYNLVHTVKGGWRMHAVMTEVV